jgi:hypothetical protein
MELGPPRTLTWTWEGLSKCRLALNPRERLPRYRPLSLPRKLLVSLIMNHKLRKNISMNWMKHWLRLKRSRLGHLCTTTCFPWPGRLWSQGGERVMIGGR